MPNPMQCVRGHRWEDESTDPFAAPAPCPVCGESASRPTDTRRSLTADEPTLVTLPPPHQPPPQPLDEGTKPGADLPRVPGYEILGVLGRGGMGVVYRARQIRADRIVALKLPHAAAGPEPRSRFRAEAQAVARLQHPDIVQVFEVGETDRAAVHGPGVLPRRQPRRPARRHPAAAADGGRAGRDGRPGGRRRPRRRGRPPRPEAGEHPARAGRRPRGADPTSGCTRRPSPKVADFGLARSLDEDQGHTRTGAVIGTPSYMAPEQAGGDARQVGPPADVYALGAILYELLTGRPPFRGPTALDTHRAGRARDDPVPPSRLQPGMPRDLETICLKCLHKSPARRYPQPEAPGRRPAAVPRRPPGPGPPGRVGGAAGQAGPPEPAPGVALLAAAGRGRRRAGSPGASGSSSGWLAERDRARAHFQMSMRAIEGLLTEVAEDDLAAEPRAETQAEGAAGEGAGVLRGPPPGRARRPAGPVGGGPGRPPGRRTSTACSAATRRPWRRTTRRPTGSTASGPTAADPDPRQEVALCHNYRGEVYRLTEQSDEADAEYQAGGRHPTRPAGGRPGPPGYALELAQSYTTAGSWPRTPAATRTPETGSGRATAAIPADTDSPGTPPASGPASRINLSNVLRKSSRPADAAAAAESAVGLPRRTGRGRPTRPGLQARAGGRPA